MQNQQPIGIFDSGLGGLSVWRELVEILPHEPMIYYGDSAFCPYGDKITAEIITRCEHITDFLLAQNCKIIVVACNTATAAAIAHLRQRYTIPFIGMEPAVKPAALQTKTGKIGVLATKGTLNGTHFHETRQKYASEVAVFTQIGYGLVEIVEQGRVNTEEAQKLVRGYIEFMLANQVDQIVLGCTHYPFLIPMIEAVTQGRASIINPAIAVARHTAHILQQNNLLKEKPKENEVLHYSFYTSGEPESLKHFIQTNFPDLQQFTAKRLSV
jgi:glutamate racemase